METVYIVIVAVGQGIAIWFPFVPDFPLKPLTFFVAALSMLAGLVVASRYILMGLLSPPDLQSLLKKGELFAQQGSYAAAKDAFLSCNAFVSAAKMAIKLGQIEEALALAKRGNDLALMAQIHVSKGNALEAAKLFDQLGRGNEAAEQWELAGDLVQALDRYKKGTNLRKIEELLRKLNRLNEIGDMYAREFREASAYAKATPSPVASERAKALALATGNAFREAREFSKAADILLQAGLFGQAAGCLEEGGEFIRASDLYCQANKSEDAARVLIKGGRFELAAEIYEDLGKSREIPQLLELAGKRDEAKAYAARLALQDGDTQKAAELFAQSGESAQAASLYAELHDHKRAGELWERGEAFADAASSYEKGGDHAKAAPLYSKIGRHSDSARCYEQHGSFEPAIKEYEAAGKFMDAGRVAENLANVERAISFYQKVPAETPEAYEANHVLGRLFLKKGLHQLAEEKFKKLCDGVLIHRNNLEVFYDYAVLLEAIRNGKKANQIYEQILTVDFHYRDVLHRKKLLEQSKSQSTSTSMSKSSSHSQETLSERRPRNSRFIPQQGAMVSSRYELLRQIGSGAMGVVFLARDRKLGREVALKFLPPNQCRPEEGEFFLREARMAGQLSHPNIVGVYDVGQEGSEFYLVMEFVDGPNLHQLLVPSQPFSLPRVVGIALQVTSALFYAHERKVVHRDIKPSNLLLTREGAVKIADFGLARMVRSAQIASTQTLGSPLYMAPEQIRGGAFDHRVDLYSFGIVLFELATGSAPFTDGEVTYHHLHSPPPIPSERRSELPPSFDSIISKLLEKDPVSRYQSAQELSEDLHKLQ